MADKRRIENYLQRLYGYAYSLAGDRHRAEDLVQECAVRALAARKAPTDQRAYRAWLFRILRNLFLDQVRQATRATARQDADVYDPEMEFWGGDERFISVLAVKFEMAKLPRRHREIIALIDIVGLSYSEAGQLLGIPVGTVMSRISRARRLLLEAIEASNIRELPVRAKKSM